jgi:hypothetical protein
MVDYTRFHVATNSEADENRYEGHAVRRVGPNSRNHRGEVLITVSEGVSWAPTR